jgi:hypothetical protein
MRLRLAGRLGWNFRAPTLGNIPAVPTVTGEQRFFRLICRSSPFSLTPTRANAFGGFGQPARWAAKERNTSRLGYAHCNTSYCSTVRAWTVYSAHCIVLSLKERCPAFWGRSSSRDLEKPRLCSRDSTRACSTANSNCLVNVVAETQILPN